ncbi:hypothetical protein LguiB_020426 [Lonicera macranthoides]
MTSRSTQKSPKRLTGRPRRKHNIVLAIRYRGTLLKAGLQRFILLKLTNNFWRLFRLVVPINFQVTKLPFQVGESDSWSDIA